mgnify:CR=1 FL=1
MRSLILIILGVGSLFLVSCATTAGPFVTAISSDGAGGLVVEKCMARFDPWMGTVGNHNCNSANIQINPKK